MGQNLFYGRATPLEAVLGLALEVDHRAAIFSEEFYYTGVSTQVHGTHEFVTVVEYTGKTKKSDYANKAPLITIPKTASQYKEYAKQSDPAHCFQNLDCGSDVLGTFSTLDSYSQLSDLTMFASLNNSPMRMLFLASLTVASGRIF